MDSRQNHVSREIEFMMSMNECVVNSRTITEQGKARLSTRVVCMRLLSVGLGFSAKILVLPNSKI
jgi:hypothetical protein